MSIMNYFKRKLTKSPQAAGSGCIFEGGDGTSLQNAVIVVPSNLEPIRRAFMEKLGDKIPPEIKNNPTGIDGMIAEMGKTIWLEANIGTKEQAGWDYGTRMYLNGSKQSQEILFHDGHSITLYYDFSKFYPNGAW